MTCYITEAKLKPITVWERFNVDSQKWEHNHIEYGHVGTIKPIGKAEHQTKNWAKGTWIHDHRYIKNGKVI